MIGPGALFWPAAGLGDALRKAGFTLARSPTVLVERNYATALHHKSAYHRAEADRARAAALVAWKADEIDERDYWRILDAIVAKHCVEVPVHRGVDPRVIKDYQQAGGWVLRERKKRRSLWNTMRGKSGRSRRASGAGGGRSPVKAG